MSIITTPVPGEIAAEWAEAWNAADQTRLAELFTTGGTYTDLAVGKTFTGQAAITQFRTISDTLIAEPAYRDREPVRRAGPDHDRVAVRRSLPGRADSFAVRGTTTLQMQDDLITDNTDNYSLATVLSQSGLFPQWTPATS